MASREDLHNKLKELLKSEEVYYRAPASKDINYPAIKYRKTKPDIKRANNAVYSNMNCYEIIVIDTEPDNPVIDELLALPYCSYDRNYTADNLEHDVLILYY